MSMPTNTPDDEKPQPQTLAAAFDEIRNSAGDGPLSIARIVEILSDRGIVVVLIILTMPFLFPIPTMGLSAPVGVAIAIYGVSVALGRKPWLPKFLMKRELSNKAVHRLAGFGTKWGKRVEHLLKPRLSVMNWAGINILTGISLSVDALLMSLPLPIPATNAIPAAAILLLLLGQLERDGVFIIAGQITSAVVLAIFAGLGYLVARLGMEGAKAWFGL
jgi:hypothetical protein